MNRKSKRYFIREAAVCLTCTTVFASAACGNKENSRNLLSEKEDTKRVVNMFSPREKSEAS
ncbi:MAG: hypothetical protein K2O13_12525, partial [Lachnospiraceae bacterium]|nr:hypothetical protein [Lachnospiraceae bacterium]